MDHKFLEPITIGNQTVKNRIFLLAMSRCMSTYDGKVTMRDLDYIEAIAKGGTGMIIPGAMVVDHSWPSTLPMQLGIWHDKFLPGLTTMVERVHKYDAKILFQLWHPGQVDYTGGKPKSINEMTVEEIHEKQALFVAAAKRAMKAGADGIEFQTCHTYLANQFLSPLWNHRTDEYGWENIDDRVRFATETISMLREAIGPDKILAVKMQGFDFPKGEGPDGNDGITPDMAAEVAPYLEKAGADMITVSSGGTLTGRDDIMSGDGHRPEGWKVPAAKKVKAAVSIPVAASGSLRHPEYIDQIISDGSCDLVGMGRGLVAEHEYVNKCAAGKEDQLRYCMSCNHCGNISMTDDTSVCSINPFACREGSYKGIKENGGGRVVAIVGAGPAGMEAAITLKQRGFEPVVFDKRGEIGGNMNIAKKPPYKYKFQWNIDYYANMARLLNIDVRLNTEATAEKILALDPYSVLIAAGSKTSTLKVDGLDKADVIQARDLLDKEMKFENKKIVIIGGGLTGLETGQYLKEQGNDVKIVDFAPPFPSIPMTPRYSVEALLDMRHCTDENIELLYEHKVLCYKEGKLYVQSVNDENDIKKLDADIVVMSVGVKPADKLYDELKEAGHPSVWKVGDANKPDMICRAVMAGSKFAYGLN